MRIEELFSELGIRARESGESYISSCPVHGGVKLDKFRFYSTGHTGHSWMCLTNSCQQVFAPNIIGLVQGYLSHEEHGWEGRGDDVVLWPAAVKWLADWLKVDYESLQVDIAKSERQQFAASVELLTRDAEKSKGICSRSQFRKWVEMPDEYFLSRRFSPLSLDRHDVGYCNNPSSEMHQRSVVPVYDNDHKMVVGVIGRTHYPLCEVCRMHHSLDTSCPAEWEHANHCKWKVSKDFNDKNFLYNLWFSKKAILDTRTVVVVEGCADVWRLASCGIENAVALLGSCLSEQQMVQLECSGCTSIICLADNDDAGNSLYQQLQQRCWFASEVYRPVFPGHDIAELTDEEVVSSGLKDFLKSKERKL